MRIFSFWILGPPHHTFMTLKNVNLLLEFSLFFSSLTRLSEMEQYLSSTSTSYSWEFNTLLDNLYIRFLQWNRTNRIFRYRKRFTIWNWVTWLWGLTRPNICRVHQKSGDPREPMVYIYCSLRSWEPGVPMVWVPSQRLQGLWPKKSRHMNLSPKVGKKCW